MDACVMLAATCGAVFCCWCSCNLYIKNSDCIKNDCKLLCKFCKNKVCVCPKCRVFNKNKINNISNVVQILIIEQPREHQGGHPEEHPENPGDNAESTESPESTESTESTRLSLRLRLRLRYIEYPCLPRYDELEIPYSEQISYIQNNESLPKYDDIPPKYQTCVSSSYPNG